jgi:hypothetical protein
MTKVESTKPKLATDPDADAIEACRAALEPLARISPKGDRRAVDKEKEGNTPAFTGQHRINRCRREVVITAADIEAAITCREGDTTLAACRNALRPLARLPQDLRVEDDDLAIYSFEGANGNPVPITNRMLMRAAELAG